MCPANERWRYSVTPSLIGWAHMQNDPWVKHRWGLEFTTETQIPCPHRQAKEYPSYSWGSILIQRCPLTSIGIPIIKLRGALSLWRKSHSLKDCFCIETGHRTHCAMVISFQNTHNRHRKNHDDVIKWIHFARYWSSVNSPHKRPVARSFGVFFDLRMNGWVTVV